MPNSSIINKVKNKIIREFIKDEEIVNAINSHNIDKKTPEKLLYTHIFDYNQNPNTLEDVMTFITVEVQIPEQYYYSKTYTTPTVEIWIVSHEKHMRVDNIPKITENRNDYLSRLIDEKLNGKSGYGIGELTLRSNTAGSFQMDYVYRKMVFGTKDLNNSLCEDE